MSMMWTMRKEMGQIPKRSTKKGRRRAMEELAGEKSAQRTGRLVVTSANSSKTLPMGS